MTSTTIVLSLAAVLTAALHIRAEYRRDRRRIYLFKPATTTLILLIALLAPAPVNPVYKTAVVAGLLFSLAGDIFLMLPADRFLAGLISFLLAHLVYLFAFTRGVGLALTPAAGLLLIAYGAVLFTVLWHHLGRMRLPAMLYMAAILLMAWQAVGRWQATAAPGAIGAAVGALLFVVSDSVLALNRFRRPFHPAQLIILTSYYAAQWLIARSVGA